MPYVSFINKSTITRYSEWKQIWKKSNSFVVSAEVEFIPLHDFSDAVEDLLRPQKNEILVPDNAVCVLSLKVLSG